MHDGAAFVSFTQSFSQYRPNWRAGVKLSTGMIALVLIIANLLSVVSPGRWDL